MSILRCACLVAENSSRLLLVRVRDNTLWYLPGGKIENDERPEETLVRELWEELGIESVLSSVQYLYTVRGPAYQEAGSVELVCFSAKWSGEITPQGEVSEVAWLPIAEKEKFAPAVQILVASYCK